MNSTSASSDTNKLSSIPPPVPVSSLFKSWVMDTETLSLTINKTLKWLSPLPVLMKQPFWWWQCSVRYSLPIPHPNSWDLGPRQNEMVNGYPHNLFALMSTGHDKHLGFKADTRHRENDYSLISFLKPHEYKYGTIQRKKECSAVFLLHWYAYSTKLTSGCLMFSSICSLIASTLNLWRRRQLCASLHQLTHPHLEQVVPN